MMKIAVKLLVASLLFAGLVVAAETIRGGDQEERKLQSGAVDQTSNFYSRQMFSLPPSDNLDVDDTPTDDELYVLELPKVKAGERVTCEFRCNEGGYGPRGAENGRFRAALIFSDVPPNSGDSMAQMAAAARGSSFSDNYNTCDHDIGAVTNMDSEHAYFGVVGSFGFENAYVSCTKQASCWGYVESARNWARTWWGA